MVEIRLLGRIDVDVGDRSGAHALLSRPKVVALLTFLAVDRPHGLKRRDKLLNLLWPELDNDRARHALRQALYELRRRLPEGALVTRGTEEIGLADDVVWCDVREVDRAAERADADAIVERYAGDLLPGFYLSGTADFDHWLEDERRRIRRAALDAVRQACGNTGATASDRDVDLARWCVGIDPRDEPSVLRLVELLVRAGNRNAARDAFDHYAARYREELDAEVPADVRECVAALMRRAATADVTMAVDAGGTKALPARSTPQRIPPAVSRAGRWVAAAGGMTAVGALLAAVLMSPPAPTPDLVTERVLVVPFANRTGASAWDHVGTMAADWITQGLMSTDFVHVYTRGTPLADWQEANDEAGSPLSNDEALDEAHRLGAGTLVTGNAFLTTDSVVVQAQIMDSRTGRVLETIEPVHLLAERPESGLERLRDRVMARIAVRTDPRLARWIENAGPPADFYAYRLFVDGIMAHVRDRDRDRAFDLFVGAYERDTTFAMALNWAIMVGRGRSSLSEKADSLLELLEGRRMRLAPLDRLLLDWHPTGINGDWYGQLAVLRRLVEVAPGSDFLKLAGGVALELNRPREGLRYLTTVDPDYGWLRYWGPYWSYVFQAHHMLGQWDEARAAVSKRRERFDHHTADGQVAIADEARLEAIAGNAVGALQRLNELDAHRRFQQYMKVAREADAHGQPEVARTLARDFLRAWESRVRAGHGDYQMLRQPLRVLPRVPEALAMLGDLDSARAVVDRWVADNPERVFAERAIVAAAQGDGAAAWREFEIVTAAWRELRWAWVPGEILRLEAEILAQLGRHEEALDRLERMDQLRPRWRLMHKSWDLKPVRDHPRFQAMLRMRDTPANTVR